MKLKNKIFITYAILISLPLLLISLVVHSILTTDKSVEVMEHKKSVLSQFNHNLDLMIDDANRNTISIFYNRELLDILKNYGEDTESNYHFYDHLNEFNLFLSSMVYKKEQVYGMHIFTPSGQVFSHISSYGMKQTVNVLDEDWYKLAKELQGGWFINPEETTDYYKKERKKMISFVRLIRDPVDKRELGAIKVDFSPSYLEKITENLGNDGDWEISINDKVILRRGKSSLLNQCDLNTNWLNDRKTNNSYLCVTDISSKTGIKVKELIAKKDIYRDITKFDNYLAIFLLIFLCGMLPLAYITSNYLLKPLEILKKQMQRRFHPADIHETTDVAELTGAYNNMLNEINNLVDQIYELNHRNIESEYKILQAKMDPHFIFNALESINMTAIANKQIELSDMIARLGRLIRYKLRDNHTYISLKDELDFCWTYVDIMKTQMNNQLLIHNNIDESVLSYQIPKYIIQPLIENAIIHGKGELPLSILISVYKEGYTLVIEVSDNGNGMSVEELKTLDIEMKRDNKKESVYKSGIALQNIYQRLKVIYGDGITFDIVSALDNGTTISIRISSRLDRRNGLDKSYGR